MSFNTELQIRGVLRIIQRYFFSYVVTSHKNRLDETFLMMGHKIGFYGEI